MTEPPALLASDRFCPHPAARCGLLMCDERGLIVHANDEAQRILCYSGRELVGTSYYSLAQPLAGEEDLTQCLGELPVSHAASAIELQQDVAAVVMMADGRRRWVQLTVMTLPDVSGRGKQMAIGVVDVTALKLSEERLACESAVADLLAHGRRFDDAVPPLVRTIRDRLGWDIGGFWTVDAVDQVIQCVFCEGRTTARSAFTSLSRTMAVPIGIDLPGRTWLNGSTIWRTDILTDESAPRILLARKEGLRSGVCLPVSIGDEVHSVLELYGHRTIQPDADVMQTLARIGAQIAQFVEQLRAQKALAAVEQRLTVVMDHVPAILFAIDRSGTLTLVEGRGLESLGLMPGEFVGHPYFDLFPRSPQLDSAVRRALMGENTVTQVQVDEIEFDTRWTPQWNDQGDIDGVFGVAVVATARERGRRTATGRGSSVAVLNGAGSTTAQHGDGARRTASGRHARIEVAKWEKPGSMTLIS